MFSANTSQVSEDRLYVEDVFSTYLYTGNDATNNITNNIDLTGKGGMVWLKSRSSGSYSHFLFDTARGAGYALQTSSTNGNLNYTTYQSFGSNGFSLFQGTAFNTSPETYASWTFRKAPKFFDVVTYTGNGTAGRTVAHSLGVAPGTIIVKRTDAANGWPVYHRSMDATPQNYQMRLNATDGKFTTSPVSRWNNTAPTATEFTLSDNDEVNGSGATYVAYLFAHDTTSDGIIQCGSYTGTGSDLTVNLGWEPQWWLVKNATTAGWSWSILDNMRGFSAASDNILQPNSSNAELTTTNISLTPTGVQYASTGNGAFNSSGATYIYIAIRRGPMRTPTSGTSVFNPTLTSTDTATTGFPVDVLWQKGLNAGWTTYDVDRLRGGGLALRLSETNAESVALSSTWSQSNTGVLNTGFGGGSSAMWSFRRAPSFFDEVCYTGTGGGTTRTLNHNLGVAPEMMIVKSRNDIGSWYVYSSALGNQYNLALQSTNAANNSGNLIWNGVTPSATTFTVGDFSGVNGSGTTYVNYLFASCPGVSKVSSYTGNGSSQTINCGFAAGARFVMIKRTDSTGDWYVWDTARGIVSGNDPHLSLNSTAAEVTTDDSVDTDSSGFVVNQLSATNINVSSATYIYLAVA